MADKKISQLPKINLISGSEVILPIVHDGTTQKMDVSTFAVFASQFSATTASNTFIGNQTINGNLTLSGNSVIGGNVEVGGMITAQQYNVTYVSSSIQYKSGSTEFGDTADDTHTITGTIILNGLALGTPELMAQTASQAAVNLGISSVTGSINTTTSSFNSVFQRISSTTGSINTTTASFDSVFLGISSVTGAINTTTSSFDSVFLGISSFTGSLNSLTGSYATTGSNTFRANQAITGSLSISAGEFNVTTGSGNATSSLIFDHTQNDGVTLELRHNDRLSVADHKFNVNVWAAGVYTTFVRNGTPYSILNVEAFDDNKIYLYRDTRLYNKSLVIDNNLTVQKDVVIGTGSLDINNGEFSITSGSGELTSSLSFTHTTIDPITGNATLALRYRNNDVGPENNAWRFVADDGGVKLSYDQYATSNKLLFSVSSLGSNFDKLLIWRDARLYGKGLTVDDSLLVKGVITGSLLATNGVVSSSNQLFELNAFTGSVIGQTNTISTFTSSVNFTTQSLNTQTGSQDLVNRGISSVTGSINTTTSSFNSVFSQIGSTTSSLIGITNGLMAFTAALDSTYATDAQLYQLYQATASVHFTTQSLNTQTGSQDLVNRGISSVTGSINTTTSSFDLVFRGISSVTGAMNTQSSSQDLVNLGISSVTGSLIGITNGLMAFTAALDTTYATDAQLYQLYQATASIHFTTQSLNTQTGSQDLVNLGISTATGSLVGITNELMALTASMKGQAIVSSSQQIINYNTFALTSSANVFFGKQSVSGALHVANGITGSVKGNLDGVAAYATTIVLANSGTTTDTSLFPVFSLSPVLASYTSLYSHASSSFFFNGVTRRLHMEGFVVSGSNNIAEISGSLNVSGSLKLGDWQHGVGVANTAKLDIRTASDRGLKINGASSSDVIITAYRGASDDMVRGMRLEGSAINIYIGDGNANTGSSVASFNTNGLGFESGKGIDFSATSNGSGTTTSELLNDYEEGTWTALLICGTSGTITLNSAAASCTYTKIGRLVNVSGYIDVQSVSSPTGRLRITGFPFTQISDGVPVGVGYLNNTNAYTGFAIMLGNQSDGAYIDRNANTGADAALDMSSAIKANSEIYFNLTYTTT
jgi:hypothetical protein